MGLSVIIMAKEQLSTFEKEMQDNAFKKQFENEYAEFLLSETIREQLDKVL